MNNTKYPNQIDDGYVNQIEALLSIENTIGVNPNGNEHSTIADRLNNLNNLLKSTINNLSLSNILSLNNCTDIYDLILGEGSTLIGIDGFVNIKGYTTITGDLNIVGSIDLNNNVIKNSSSPIEPNDLSNKSYIDTQINSQNEKLNKLIQSLSNKNNTTIQYTEGISQPFPEGKSNQYLKRNIENTGWEFQSIELKPIYDKFETLETLISNVSKNNTFGSDITVNIGDAIKSEDDFLNLDSNVTIHKNLLMYGDIDLEYHSIINSKEPINSKDLANKQYVDDKIPKNIIISDTLIEDVNIYYKDGIFKANIIRLDPGNEDRKINGIKFPDISVQFILINIGTNNIILKNNGDTDFGNHFQLVNYEDLTIPPNGVCTLFYDNQNSFWRVLNVSF